MPPCFTAVRRCGWLGLLGLPALVLATPAAAEPLTERQAIERALADADAVARDRAQRAAAQAAARSVPLFENPDLTVSQSRLEGPASEETEREIGVTQPLDLSGRRARLRAAARAEAAAVDADVDRSRQERVAQVRRAYASCAAAVEKHRLAAAFGERLRAAERIAAERTAAGDSAGYDLRRIRIAARTAAAEATLGSGEVEADCAALSNLTGVAEPRPATPLPDLLSLRPDGSLAARPDLLAQERRVSAAEANARAAERARIPELRVGLGYRELEVMGQRASGPVISLGATVPLFSRGGAQAEEARARARVAAAELALARRRAQADAASAAARAQAARRALAAAEETRDDAARLGGIAETAYQAGETGVTELVDAYRAAHEAEFSIVELTERTVLAAIELDLAQGEDVP